MSNIVKRKEKKSIKPCGFIYEIRNKVNDKVYIGKTTKEYHSDRKYEHLYLLRKGIHHNAHLQNSFNKYGEHNFDFKVIVYVYSPDRLDPLEREFIWRNKSTDSNYGYNLTEGGDGGSRSSSTYGKMKRNRVARMRGLFIRMKNEQIRNKQHIKRWTCHLKIKTNLKTNSVISHNNLFPKKQYKRFREDLELSKVEYYQWQWNDNNLYPFSPKTQIVNDGVMFHIDQLGEL